MDDTTPSSAEKLKELWEAASADPLPPKEFGIFTKAKPQRVKDLCQEIAQSNISEIGVATACKQLTDISREMKVENVTAFASSLLMPQVVAYKGDMASKLVPTLKMFGAKYGKQLIEGVLVPCALSTHLDGLKSDLVLQVLKSLNGENKKTFLRMFLAARCPLSDTTSALLLKVLEMKPDLDGELLSVLVSALASNGVEMKKGSQFGKIAMAIIGKYGKELSPVNIAQLGDIMKQNETSMKKQAMTALAKLRTR